MKKDKKNFEKNAKNLIEFVIDPSTNELIYESFCRHEPDFLKTGLHRFCQDFVPAKLALGCGFWIQCCEVHGMKDKDVRNFFFREVMKRFETPNSLEVARRFSESLYAVNSHPEESPVLSIVTHLFEKLGLKRISGEKAESGISSSFFFMMEAGEALKNAFENEFDELIYSNEDYRPANNK